MEKDILKKIISDYENRYSLRKLSKKYGYSVGNLHYHLTKINIIRKNNIIKAVNIFDEFLIGIFIGLWAGDGSKFIDRGRYSIKFHLNKNDNNLINFIKELMLKLFNKNIRATLEKETNRATIIFYSKFIYNFIDDYVSYGENKTLTVRLKRDISNYSINFLKGFLVGMCLSDGYLKEKYILNLTSYELIKNNYEVLDNFNFESKIYLQNREKYGWSTLYSLKLNRLITISFIAFLNNAIKPYTYLDIVSLKYK